MRRFLALAAVLSLTAGSPTALSGCDGAGGTVCCKVCTTGRACGDSCISATSTCDVGPGCACDGAAGLVNDPR